MSSLPTVVVAMSGGVDSSVAAAILVRKGYPVIGMMLRLWSEAGMEAQNRCCTPDAMAQARRVAGILGIPFYAIDAVQPFRDQVVESFLTGYASGETPNPCLICNRTIRWGLLFDEARNAGAEFLATGHYARLEKTPAGKMELYKARDPKKDQSYVLSVLNQDRLAHTMFPLGDFVKTEVREMARNYGLPVAERADSQDLCFLAGQDYRQFLARNAPETVKPGKIINQKGEVLGEHQGLAFYTIGQRKGLGLAAPQPLYVLEKRLGDNQLVVGEEQELGQTQMTVDTINWLDGDTPNGPIDVDIKIRYKAELRAGTVVAIESQKARVNFLQPARDITPGQRAVFYDGDRVLGGGIISGYQGG